GISFRQDPRFSLAEKIRRFASELTSSRERDTNTRRKPKTPESLFERSSMKHYTWIMALMLAAACVAPAFAQDPEDSLRELGMGGIFAEGNLALRMVQRGDDPVQQLKRFFAQAKLPLTSAQQKQLTAILDIQIKALHDAGENEEAIRVAN